MERPALVRNAGSESQVKRAKETEKQRATREDGELDEVLSTYAGRSVLWKILSQRGPNSLSFDPDPYRTAFNEGQRNIVNWLLVEITKLNLPAYQIMQAEAAKRDAMIQDPKNNKKRETDENTELVEDDDGN